MAQKNITLGFLASGDTRKPRTVRLMVQNQDFEVDLLVDLSEHDFTALLAGMNVKAEAEIG